MPLIAKAATLYKTAVDMLARYGGPVFDLFLRIWLGLVFFRAGLVKLNDWEATVYLFAEEYKVPFLPPELAAVLGAATELGAPLLLFIGLGTRLAALPLLGLVATIQFVLGAANPAYDQQEHIYWLLLLCVIVLRGGGMLSADHVIARTLTLHSR